MTTLQKRPQTSLPEISHLTFLILDLLFRHCPSSLSGVRLLKMIKAKVPDSIAGPRGPKGANAKLYLQLNRLIKSEYIVRTAKKRRHHYSITQKGINVRNQCGQFYRVVAKDRE
jgi:hypothetical protein